MAVYKTKPAKVKALRISGVHEYPDLQEFGLVARRYVVDVETDRGEIIPVICAANIIPVTGDYVIFLDIDDVFHVQRLLFESKYEEIIS